MDKIFQLIKQEEERQKKAIHLIASENYVSENVRRALGSVLTNKYAEGYVAKRYYAGQKYIDQIEKIAIERALKIFGLSAKTHSVNVQPLSGSPANMAVYTAFLEPGDKVLAMDLKSGGHLTHGAAINFSGKLYHFHHYGVDKETHLLDYNEIEKLAKRIRPKMIVSGATAYPRKIDFKKFQQIAEKTGALHMVDISHLAGLIVAGSHPSPFPFSDVVTTTTHKTLRGPRGAIIISKNKYAEKIDKAIFPGLQGGPHENNIAAMAVCFQEAMSKKFQNYGQQIVKNCRAFAGALIKNGFKLITNGTDNHLLLIDFTNEKITAKQAQEKLEAEGIYTNRNSIPFDSRPPYNPSGLRLGTAFMTTMRWREDKFIALANKIAEILKWMYNKIALQ